MIDERDLFVQASMRFAPPAGALESFNRRRERKRRNQRIAALAIGVIVAAVVFGGLARVILQSEPMPAAPPSIFDQVHGWIAVGTQSGVEAVDPEAPSRRVLLTSTRGAPLAWSQDGSQLLLNSGRTLSVLGGDGSITPVPHTRDAAGIGFTPDGSEVVFDRRNVYAVNVATGLVRTIAATPSKNDYILVAPFSGGGMSPDGARLVIAPEGFGPSGLSLMNVNDGTLQLLVSDSQARRLHRDRDYQGVVPGAWSPDGSRIAFTTEGKSHCVLAVVDADGSNLTPLTTPSRCTVAPTWSPDGSQVVGTNQINELRVVNADGSGMRTIRFPGGPFLYAAWNPIPAR
jgi:Tol biopolymer transport system component